MSLSRLALRLAAFEALRPSANVVSDGPWPTLAGNRVWDSRLNTIAEQVEAAENLDELEDRPLVLLFTEDTDFEAYPPFHFPPEKTFVHLVAEIALATRGPVEVDVPFDPENPEAPKTMTVGAVVTPVTDRTREALLDVLEHQVVTAVAGLPSWLLMEIHHIRSVPMRAADKSTVLAARTIVLRCRVVTTARLQPPAPDTTGLALLPNPLRRVATTLLPTGSTGAAECLRIAALLQQPTAPPLLQTIAYTATMGGQPAVAPPPPP